MSVGLVSQTCEVKDVLPLASLDFHFKKINWVVRDYEVNEGRDLTHSKRLDLTPLMP